MNLADARVAVPLESISNLQIHLQLIISLPPVALDPVDRFSLGLPYQDIEN